MQLLEEINPEALLADGFEDAYIGVCEVFNRPPLAAYDRDRCIEILMERDEMDRDEAEEYFNFNVSGSWVGENTPVYISLSEKGD
tara:strand:+ start:439 stop:693 length:255 start_codon:yes stop_codon:yes gene_type:complete